MKGKKGKAQQRLKRNKVKHRRMNNKNALFRGVETGFFY